MNYIYIGKIVNTHGIKGEIRLLSNFLEKDLIFKTGFKIYIGSKKEEKIIERYRRHKNFDMLTFKGINDINDVLKYKKMNVYVKRDDLKLSENEFILEDLIGMNIICDDEEMGVVNNIYHNKSGNLLAITFAKNYYIPYNNYYIKEVDVLNKIIKTEHTKDLIL